MIDELWVQEQVKKHTLHTQHPVETSTGRTNTYLDGIGMLLDQPEKWRQYFEDRIPYASSMGRQKVWPVAQGASGALVLGLLGRGSLLRSPHKRQGILWSGEPQASELAFKTGTGMTPVVLVDDCKFSGQTMVQLASECMINGWSPVGEITCWPYVSDRLVLDTHEMLGRPIV